MLTWLRSGFLRATTGGYLSLGRWSGIPVRLHWTGAVGALVFSGFRWEPAFWFAFVFVIALHEMGHAVVIRRFRARPIALEIHGLGGLCRWQGDVTRIEAAAIAWGGVTAQLLLCVITLATVAALGAPTTPEMRQLRYAFVEDNVFLIFLNLVPIPPLDGARAWTLPGLLLQRRQARRNRDAKQDSIRHLRQLDEAEAQLAEVPDDVKELARRATEDALKATTKKTTI